MNLTTEPQFLTLQNAVSFQRVLYFCTITDNYKKNILTKKQHWATLPHLIMATAPMV